jgi:hypothetical protein
MPIYLKTSTATNSWRQSSVYLKTSTATNSWRKVVSAFIKTASGWQLIFGKVGPQIDFPLEISSNSNSYPATLTGKNYHWDSGTTFTSKFQKASTSSGTWSDVTSFESILNPASGSSNTKTLILLESHFILNQSSTFFRFVVRAQNTVSGQETTEVSPAIEISVPNAVMSHTGGAIVATSTSISIPFTQNSFLKYYIVEAYGPSGLVSSTTVNTPTSPVLVENLSPNTTYDIVIYPYNFVNIVGTALLASNITTLAGTPGTVTNLTRSTGNAGSKTFSWSAPTTGGAVTSYQYQLNNLGFFSNGASTSINLTGLSGTNVFQVRAVNASGTGTAVSTGSFVIPTINSGPTAGSITSSSATVSWTSSNQESYSLSIPGAPATPYGGSTATSRSITSLSSSTSYTPTLTITSSTGDTATTTGSAFTTLVPAPSVPTITYSNVTSNSFTVSWSSSGATSYTVQIYESISGNSVAGYPQSGVTATSASISGLQPSRGYSTTITAINSGGSAVNTASTTTLAPPAVIPTITMGANSGISQTAGTINWTSTNQASFSSTGTFSGSGTTQTSITNNSLSAGTTYTGTVTVTSSTGNTASANYSLTTSVAQYTVTWNANGGTGGGSTTQNAGVAHTAPSPGTRSGFTFTGYNNTPSGDFLYGPIASGGSFTPPSSITMYARWAAIVPNVTQITALGLGNTSAPYIRFTITSTNAASLSIMLYRSATSSTGPWTPLASPSIQSTSGTLVADFSSRTGTTSNWYYVDVTPYFGASATGTSGTTRTSRVKRGTETSTTTVYP